MLSEFLTRNLVCPRDRNRLEPSGSFLVCTAGHDYPVVDGVPVLLLEDRKQTIGVAQQSIAKARRIASGEPADDPLFVETLGINAEEKAAVRLAEHSTQSEVDPVARFMIGATNGILYRDLIGKIDEYPVPELRLPPGHGKKFLDVGCNWGRWSIAACRLNYRPVGLDPSLGAVLAARRVMKQLDLNADFVVGDARFLPFRNEVFDTIFSYSVLQHFSKQDAQQSLAEFSRVLKPSGTSLIQMPNRLGLRCLFHQAKRHFRRPVNFEVRYWSITELQRTFSSIIGPTKLSVDCFFGIGLQGADLRLMPPRRQRLIQVSELLRKTADKLHIIRYLADSLYVQSIAVRRAS
jgi:ubiquinone/menaquinone biosynthesis C-methylase UbiE/uncharacterized protein YbaR (Trm112 family)